jgi:hypothetical protein
MPELDLHDYAVKIAVLEEKVQAAEREKILQAKEYERRLSDLNHAHEQAVKRNAEFVSSELHDAGMRELRTSVKTVEDKADAIAKAVEEKATAITNKTEERVAALSAKVNIGIGIILTLQVLVFVVLEAWKR